jgi:hypothetical protein
MDRTLVFRRGLMTRLLRASVVGLPVAAVAGAACGANVVVDQSAGSTAGTGGTGGAGTTNATIQEMCFAWPPPGTGAPACPDQTQAPTNLGPQLTYACDQVLSGGAFTGTACCYEVQIIHCLGTGRPYAGGGRPRTAPPQRASEPEASRPDLAGLTPSLRARLAAAWAADGLLEHASIASFGRFAFELMAVGAPPELVAEAHRAALDEVEHARLCLGLAGAYAGEGVAPGPFPFEGRVAVSHDLADVAARAAREGCVGETLASVQAAEQLAWAEDPRVHEALTIIVEDEARHAELSWRFVAWAIGRGGAEVRAAVARAFAEPVALPERRGALPPSMRAHGRLDPALLRAALERALDDVVRPCAERLLAAA